MKKILALSFLWAGLALIACTPSVGGGESIDGGAELTEAVVEPGGAEMALEAEVAADPGGVETALGAEAAAGQMP